MPCSGVLHLSMQCLQVKKLAPLDLDQMRLSNKYTALLESCRKRRGSPLATPAVQTERDCRHRFFARLRECLMASVPGLGSLGIGDGVDGDIDEHATMAAAIASVATARVPEVRGAIACISAHRSHQHACSCT